MLWLRYLVVYSTPKLLHLGKAVPRAWLKAGEVVDVRGVRTHYGTVSSRWSTDPERKSLVLEADIGEPGDAPRLLARFRHPDSSPMRSVSVNGQPWTRFDPRTEDVDITGLSGKVRVVASY